MIQTFDDVNKRWKHVKVELLSAQTMLEEVIQYWKRYSACVDLLNVYLADAERVVEETAEQRAVSDPFPPSSISHYPILLSYDPNT